MKSHEQKMHEKKAHESELERNDLNAWFQKTWANLKSGQIASKRFMIGALVVGVAIGLVIYFLGGRRTAEAAAWKTLDGANTLESLDDIAKNSPNTVQGKVARLQKARQLLGPQGVMQMSNNLDPAIRAKALKSIEEARELFTKLADEFKDDLTLTAQSLDGAAHAELALVGIPKESSPQESRGSVDKAIDLFRRYAKVAGETAGEPAKKMADDLEKIMKEGTEKGKVTPLQLGQYLNEKLNPKPKPDIKMPSLTPEPAPPTPNSSTPPK
jgi:hypothetical protein